MGHDKLRKFAENETFKCLLQPSSEEVLSNGYFNLKDHPIKGNWARDMFGWKTASEGSADSCEGAGTGGKAPEIILELGCGKGEYTLDLARRYPDKCFIGVDIKGARLWRGAKTATLEKIGNVAFLRTRIEFLTAFFADSEISEIWLTFSDPQMKSENSRLSSPQFLERYRRILKPGGIVHLKTDSRFLHEYTCAVVAANGLKVGACTKDLYAEPEVVAACAKNLCAEPEVAAACDKPSAVNETATSLLSKSTFVDSVGISELDSVVYQVRTFYEKMFLEMGLPITYMNFVIDHEGEYLHPDFDEKFWREAEGKRRSFGHGGNPVGTSE